MVNITSILKSETARVSRSEVRAEVGSLKKASAQHRSAIAQLRRQVAELQKQLKPAGRQEMGLRPSAPPAEADAGEGTPRRFGAARLAAHRNKLGLCAAAYGKLVGMSGATIFNWEQSKSPPNAQRPQQLASVRALGKRAVLEQLSSAS
jgi:DNA-binding transcriptional regulator YiaG